MRKIWVLSHFSNPRLIHSCPGRPMENKCASLLKSPVMKEMLETRIRRKVGNGSIGLFWHKNWVDSGPLKSKHPRLFLSSTAPNDPIASFGYWIEKYWAWQFSCTRALRVRDKEELEDHQSTLKNVYLSHDNDDVYIWTPSKSDEFSVKSVTVELAKSQNLTSPLPMPVKKIC